MADETPNPTGLQWQRGHYGQVPDVLSRRRLEVNLRPEDDNIHLLIRRLKHVYTTGTNPNLDSGLLQQTQKEVEVSLIGHMMRLSGFDIDVSQVPHPSEYIQVLENLGISTEPIMLAKRNLQQPAAQFALNFQSTIDMRRIAERRKGSDQFLADLHPNNEFVIDIGVLSGGIPVAFANIALELRRQIMAGHITEQQATDQMNANLGLGAIHEVSQGNIKVGISLNLVDRIIQNFQNPEFDLLICDDVIDKGITFAAIAAYFRNELKTRGYQQEEVSKFMKKLRFATALQESAGGIYDENDNSYSWKVKPLATSGDTKEIFIDA